MRIAPTFQEALGTVALHVTSALVYFLISLSFKLRVCGSRISGQAIALDSQDTKSFPLVIWGLVSISPPPPLPGVVLLAAVGPGYTPHAKETTALVDPRPGQMRTLPCTYSDSSI